MTIQLPQGNNNLGDFDHAQMHRAVAVDDKAPDESIVVNPDGTVSFPFGLSTTPTYGEIVNGSGINFTLLKAPTQWSVIIGNRTRLYPNIDYTISGANITMINGNTFNAGDILCDYL
jgi:hypothetical protein